MDDTQENALEQALRLAANEPGHRPAFYRQLCQSTVYVLGRAGDGEGEGETTLAPGSQVGIQLWEKPDGERVMPFFTSLEVLRASIESEQSYLAIPAQALFALAAGTPMVLNPRSPYGKAFTPEEVARLLSGQEGQAPVSRTMTEETQVLLGQPAHYPTALVASLSQLFARHRQVKRAFLALMHDRRIDEKPHLVVGLEADGELDQVMRDAGMVAADVLPTGEALDMFKIEADDDAGLSGYFRRETKPFYERRWSARLAGLFGRRASN